MKCWENALKQFLENWMHREEVVGAMVCGSYVTGNPSNRSDIDVHIILAGEVDWRERGNQIIDGFLIEYFVNPPKQIRNYFKEDFRDRSTSSMVQFITGKIVFDKTGIIMQLKEEAQSWKEKVYTPLPDTIKEIRKYGLWDSYDNLLDCYEEGRYDFNLIYYCSLQGLFNTYCALLNLEEIPFYQIARYLTEPTYLEKYLKQPFPDRDFAALYICALQETDASEKISLYKALTDHVHEKSGGFQIDGWRIRSSVD